MNSHRGFLTPLAVTVLIGTIGVLSLLAPAGHAEVGVIVDPVTQNMVSSYVMEGIIDEPEPVGIGWSRLSADSPSRVVLNDNGLANGDGPPAMAIGISPRMPIVVWARNSAQGYDIVVSRFVAGVWTTPFVLADSAADELDPSITVDPGDGSIHVVYWIDDTDPRVIYRKAPADLSSWTAPEVVSPPGQIAVRPSVLFRGGQLYVAYENHDYGAGNTPRQIILARRNGNAFTIEWGTLTTHSGPNWPVVHGANGRIWIDWVDAEGEMTWSVEVPGIGWGPVSIEPFADPEDLDYQVRGRIRHQALE